MPLQQISLPAVAQRALVGCPSPSRRPVIYRRAARMPAASAKVQNGSSSSGGGGSGAGGGGGSPSRLATQSQQEGSRRLFYQEAAHMLAAGAAQSSLQKSPYDFEVFFGWVYLIILFILLLLNRPLIHHNLPLVLKRIRCGIIGWFNNQQWQWWCNSISERGGLNN